MKARWVWPVPLMLALLWLGGFAWFVKAAQDSAATMDSTDAIVVLTGGAERVETGFRLLADGLAPRLFVSGVHPDSRLQDLVRSTGPLSFAGSIPVPRTRS